MLNSERCLALTIVRHEPKMVPNHPLDVTNYKKWPGSIGFILSSQYMVDYKDLRRVEKPIGGLYLQFRPDGFYLYRRNGSYPPVHKFLGGLIGIMKGEA